MTGRKSLYVVLIILSAFITYQIAYNIIYREGYEAGLQKSEFGRGYWAGYQTGYQKGLQKGDFFVQWDSPVNEPGIDISDGVLNWAIEYGDRDNSQKGLLPQVVIDVVSETFESIYGWQRAGIDFIYVSDSEKADIVIRITPDLNTFINTCGGSFAACQVTDDTTCLIFINPDHVSLDQREYLLVQQIIEVIADVNHEFGHCMGLSHSNDGVMGGAMSTLFPTQFELETVRYYLEIPVARE